FRAPGRERRGACSTVSAHDRRGFCEDNTAGGKRLEPERPNHSPQIMNLALLSHEWFVLGLGLGLLLADLWLPASARRKLGYAAAVAVGAILLYSLLAVHLTQGRVQYGFGNMYVLDELALFFKRFFLLAALIVLLMSVEF